MLLIRMSPSWTEICDAMNAYQQSPVSHLAQRSPLSALLAFSRCVRRDTRTVVKRQARLSCYVPHSFILAAHELPAATWTSFAVEFSNYIRIIADDSPLGRRSDYECQWHAHVEWESIESPSRWQSIDVNVKAWRAVNCTNWRQSVTAESATEHSVTATDTHERHEMSLIAESYQTAV